MDNSEYNGNNGSDEYILSQDDAIVINATKQLLWKIARWESISAMQLEVLAHVLQVFENLPSVSPEITATIQLISPTREYGSHLIHHFWEVEVEAMEIKVLSGGHFYRPSTGGDSFTSMIWRASPGFASEHSDYLHVIVDDAKPYDIEVRDIDLSDSGYTLSVTDDYEEVIGKESKEQEDQVDEESSSVSSSRLKEAVKTLEKKGVEVIWNDRELTGVYHVDLKEVLLTDSDFALFQTFNALNSLDARNSGISDRTIVFISHLESLEWLCIRNTAVTDEGLRYLKRLTNLQYLDLSRTQIAGPGLQYLSSLNNLHELLVSGFQHHDPWLDMIQSELPTCKVFLM